LPIGFCGFIPFFHDSIKFPRRFMALADDPAIDTLEDLLPTQLTDYINGFVPAPFLESCFVESQDRLFGIVLVIPRRL
jgi:hypothetical protein